MTDLKIGCMYRLKTDPEAVGMVAMLSQSRGALFLVSYGFSTEAQWVSRDALEPVESTP